MKYGICEDTSFEWAIICEMNHKIARFSINVANNFESIMEQHSQKKIKEMNEKARISS